MKKLLFLLFAAGFSYNANATHLMGGDLTIVRDTGGSPQINIHLYRDVLGIPFTQYEPIDVYVWNSSANDFVFQVTMQAYYNAALSTALLPSFPYGVEVGVFTLPTGFPPGKYRLVYYTCCRNGAIGNATAPLNESMILSTDYEIPALPAVNSTPECLAMPVAYFPTNSPATYNPIPYDQDADSISWSLNTPVGNYSINGGFGVYTNVAGFTTPPADPAGPFTMNPITGEISWTPNQTGNFIQSFQIKEYRNGVQIGRIVRDMQYVIVNGAPPPSFVTNTPFLTNTAEQYNYLYYTENHPLHFQISGTDANPNATVEMQSFGELYQGTNTATFTTTGAGNNVTGNFNWTPPANFTKDVIMVFRLRNGTFTKDFTLLLRHTSTPQNVATTTNTISSLTVYPNPAHNSIQLNLDLTKGMNADVSVYSTLGVKVKTIYEGKLPKGTTQMKDDLNLAAGMYYITVKEDGKTIKTQTLAIQ